MKLITPEISWHQKEPIFSVDFCSRSWKLASCGADFTIKVLYLYNNLVLYSCFNFVAYFSKLRYDT